MRSQLVAAPSYIARSGAPACPEQLADHAALTCANVRPHHRWALEHLGGSASRSKSETCW
ncbi:hypothetical protein [Methylobacterium aquaticum]|uniref:hypothetical protein n=1 Tax=Methylobacterium aquaticum TaxID=270351 RepID=UPI003CCA6A27